MITVKLFGTLRLNSGVKVLTINASSLKKMYEPLYIEITRINPEPGFTLKELKSCLVAVNGKRAGKNIRLYPGDEVCILSSAGGG